MKDHYTITERKVRRWFNIFNKVIFDNQLYPFKNIVLINHKNAYAYCIPKINEDGVRYNDLSLNTHFKSRRLFLEVLAHEMVHAWQWQIKQSDLSHGKVGFFCWKEKFAQYNIRLLVKKYSMKGLDTKECHISKAVRQSTKIKKPTIKHHPLLD